MTRVRGGGLVHSSGGMIGAKWWFGWSPGVVRWLEPRGDVTYKLLFCSKWNAALVVVTCEMVGTLNHYTMVKKNY